MGQYTYIVLTNPVEGREDEYNDWYDNTHLHDALRIPGFVAAQRFELADAQRAEPPHPWKYLAIYELEIDDPQKTVDALAAAYNTPDMIISEALSQVRLGWIYQPITERLEAKR
ncbi:hypothetical protein LO762_07965 [Actinocorallia sp. API 0066]|uniref:DUF4286 family protein n=1 Tax=Actinocorallia sp. API 0066 TaxID=2896846 RepID=UPI001E2D7919|nr:DUF4286 family protein [Actinocorallia sp. API 0066]MCD0449124.1 hypothetical protein [Actinocorallia sp. API 0066]